MKNPVSTFTRGVAADGARARPGRADRPRNQRAGTADRRTTRTDEGSGRSPPTVEDSGPTTPGSFAWAAWTRDGGATHRSGSTVLAGRTPGRPTRRASPPCAPQRPFLDVRWHGPVRCSSPASAGAVRPGDAHGRGRDPGPLVRPRSAGRGLSATTAPRLSGPRLDARHGSALLSGARRERRSRGRTTRPRIAPRKLVEIQIQLVAFESQFPSRELDRSAQTPGEGERRRNGGGPEEGSVGASSLPPDPGRSDACGRPRIVGRARARLTGRAGRPRGAGAQCPRTR